MQRHVVAKGVAMEARLSPAKSVSVIIPNLHSPVIDRTLASLQAQTFDLSQVQVLVVGQDAPQLVVENELVRFIPTPRPVIQAIARNIGARQAQGEILVFIDSDCIAAPNWLQTLVDRFRDPGVHLVGGGLVFDEDDYWTLCDNIAILYAWLSTSPGNTRSFLASLNMALQRAAWEKIGGFDESFAKAEDTEFSIRARRAGYRLYFEPGAVVTHRPATSRNEARRLVRRAFESGYWTMSAFALHQDEIGLSPLYRRAWLTLLLAPLTAAGIVLKIFRQRELCRFWYTLPVVYVSKFMWRVGGAYRLWKGPGML
jgi:GT2 family glycosyltransferase